MKGNFWRCLETDWLQKLNNFSNKKVQFGYMEHMDTFEV